MFALQSKVSGYKDISARLKALEAISVDPFILSTLSASQLVSMFFCCCCCLFGLLLKDMWPFNPKWLLIVFTAPEVFLD